MGRKRRAGIRIRDGGRGDEDNGKDEGKRIFMMEETWKNVRGEEGTRREVG